VKLNDITSAQYDDVVARSAEDPRVVAAEQALRRFYGTEQGARYARTCSRAADQLQREWYGAEFTARHYARSVDQEARAVANALETALTVAENDAQRDLLLAMIDEKE
jgi:hypothetical protein